MALKIAATDYADDDDDDETATMWQHIKTQSSHFNTKQRRQ